MRTTSKSWILPIVVAKGVLFSVVFTVSVRLLDVLFGVAQTKHGVGNMLMLGSMLTGVLCVLLYSKATKEMEHSQE